MSLSTGPIFPSPDVLNELECGKFVLSNLAAKRAKQLKEGAPALIRCESYHPLTIALTEIAAGLIKPILGAEEVEVGISRGGDLAILDDSSLPNELGILLPALDETEVELVSAGVLIADDHEVEHDPDVEEASVSSLSDLLEETEVEPDVEQIVGDEDTLSLSEIAEQENADEEAENEE